MDREWSIPGEEDPEEMKLRYSEGKFVLGWMAGRGEKKWMEKELGVKDFFDPDENWYWYRIRSLETSRAIHRLLAELTELLDPPSGRAGTVYRCYQKLRGRDFEPFSFEMEDSEIKISPDGVGFYRDAPRWAPTRPRIKWETIPELFLLGPEPIMPDLSQRRELRDHLREIFDMPAEGFPLYDYSLLEKGRWQYDLRGSEGKFAEVAADHIIIGGWSNPRDGGARSISFERFFTSRRERLYIAPEIRKEIESRLNAALVT